MIRPWLSRLSRLGALPRWQKLGLIAGMILLGTLIYIKDFTLHRFLTDKEQLTVDQLLTQPQTRCIGQYLIELPEDFKAGKGMQFHLGGTNATIIDSKHQYRGPFNQFLQRHEKALRETQYVPAIDGDYLKRIYPLDGEMMGQIFERMRSVGVSDVSRVLEGYSWDNEVTFKAELRARDGRAERYNEDRKTYPNSFNYDIPEKLSQLKRLLSRLEARDDSFIPTEPGLCIANGFLKGSVIDEYYLNVGYRNIQGNNLYINIKTDSEGALDYSLLEQDERVVTRGKSHTVYKGSRTINGLPIEEWIVKGNLFNENKGYQFFLAIYEKEASVEKPSLNIRMDYRIDKQAKPDDILTEDELLTFWKGITETLRLREGAL